MLDQVALVCDNLRFGSDSKINMTIIDTKDHVKDLE